MDGKRLFCNRKCSGLSKKLNKTKEQLVEEKRIYDSKYRLINFDKIKSRKAEAFKRNYDPVKAAVIRKERMHLHVAYCRTEKYKAWKKEYDKKYRAKQQYGEFWEAFLLLMNIEDEVYSRMDYYTIKFESGILNKTQRRKRHERSNSTKLERSAMGNP